jgi:subtilase family serine protease
MNATALGHGRGARRARHLWSVLMIAAGLSAVAASAATAPVSGVPPLLAHATDMGPVSGSSPVEVTVWLRLHDEGGLDSTLEAQQSGKAAYLTSAQIEAQHAPSAGDVAKVSAFLKAQGLTVTGVGLDNLFVKASGTASRVQRAFHVELHQYSFHGRNFRASNRGATLPPDLAPLVTSVGGLSTHGAQPYLARRSAKLAERVHIMRQSDPEGLNPRRVSPKAGANGLIFSPQCIFGETSMSFSGNGATATYEGTRYGADINNTDPGTVGPCGYQPSDIYTAYNLNPLYEAGLDGRGTTIAIVDAFGSTTIAQDAQAFAAFMGLPPVDLTIVGTPTESNFSTDPNAGWATETTLDVEWVHAIAPGAKILLVIAPTNFDSDLFAAIATASATPGVVAISNSWGDIESDTDVPSRAASDAVLKVANARGQTVNFSSGDSGNFTILGPGPGAALGYIDVSSPSNSPYATSVGGVSVALDSHQHIAWQTSWGTNLTEIVDRASLGSPPLDPPGSIPLAGGGGGGGVSNVYPAPSWQHGLGSARRLQPDISWVADPFTGVEIIFTANSAGDLGIEVIGGTSVSCPMFTGLWGIATQRAHHKLGPAAPRLYRLPPGAITDVLATPSHPGNVTGTIQDASGTQHLSASELAAPLSGQPKFISALYNSPFSTRWFVITFGVDTSLEAGPGWDQATGLGTPNGWRFVQAVGGEDD